MYFSDMAPSFNRNYLKFQKGYGLSPWYYWVCGISQPVTVLLCMYVYIYTHARTHAYIVNCSRVCIYIFLSYKVTINKENQICVDILQISGVTFYVTFCFKQATFWPWKLLKTALIMALYLWFQSLKHHSASITTHNSAAKPSLHPSPFFLSHCCPDNNQSSEAAS